MCALQIAPYSPAYNTPDSPGNQPPPRWSGTMRASQMFRTEPAPLPKDVFGRGTELTFELRPHSARAVRSSKRVTVVAGNSTPLGRVMDQAISKAFETGTLQVGSSYR
jgi:hypothetical protein